MERSHGLIIDLTDFLHSCRQHGPLTGDATEPAWNGYLLAVACPCGVVFGRWVTLGDTIDALISWSGRKVSRN